MKYELSDDVMNIIGAGLGKLPFEISAPVVTELQKQYREQSQPQPAPEEKKKK